MSITSKPLPKFEAPLSYEKYAESGMYGAQGAQMLAAEEPAEIIPDEPVNQEDPGPVETAESFDMRVSKVVSCVGAQNSLREVLYKTLQQCEEPHEFAEVEAFIANQDEFVYSHIIQTPYTLIHMLIRAGGLTQTPLDSEGNVLDAEFLATLSEEEAADAVATYLVQTTPEGAQAVRLLAPEHRIEAQLTKRPHRRETYYAVLDYCTTPRKFPEIEAFFKATPGLVQDVVAHHHKLSPDFYVDKLDKAGALVWRGAWVATDAGKNMLAVYKAQAGSKASAAAAVSPD